MGSPSSARRVSLVCRNRWVSLGLTACALLSVPVTAIDRHALGARQAGQRQRGGDLREGVIVDVVLVVEDARMRDPGDLPKPTGRVSVGDTRPGLGQITQDARGFGGVGGHELE